LTHRKKKGGERVRQFQMRAKSRGRANKGEGERSDKTYLQSRRKEGPQRGSVAPSSREILHRTNGSTIKGEDFRRRGGEIPLAVQERKGNRNITFERVRGKAGLKMNEGKKGKREVCGGGGFKQGMPIVTQKSMRETAYQGEKGGIHEEDSVSRRWRSKG